jgi:uncharacterized protein
VLDGPHRDEDGPVTVSNHGIPVDDFTALATGGGGEAAVRRLTAAQYSKRLTLLHGVLEAGETADSSEAGRARDAFQLLAAADQHRPGAAASVIRHPSVGAWALRATPRARLLLTNGTAPAVVAGWPIAAPSWLCTVAAAAAIKAGLTARVEVPSVDGMVFLPSLGAAKVGAEGSAVVRTTAEGAEIRSGGRLVRVPPDPREEGPGWLPVREIRAGTLHALLDDLDPFRMPSLEPLSPRLSAAELADWTAALLEGWSQLPSVPRAEISETVSAVVPCGIPPGGNNMSQTSAHVFGAVAMSLPSDPWSCAETLVHEGAHLKLFAVNDIVALTVPDDGQRYYAPWREDPRPAAGLLHGAYAFLAVAGFWRHHREPAVPAVQFRAHTEFARWSSGAALVAQTLLHSTQLTAHGLEFVQGMADTLTAWLAEPVPPDARRAARSAANAHLVRWESRHGPLPDRQRPFMDRAPDGR